MIEFTSLIQATSTNPICLILCSNLKEYDRLLLNYSLTSNPVIRAISNGQNYISFRGKLCNFPNARLVEIICWSVFWNDFVPILVENHASNATATMNFQIANMQYESYCLEFEQCVREIALLGYYNISLLRELALTRLIYEDESN